MIGWAVIEDIVIVTTLEAKATHKKREAAVTEVISPLFNNWTITCAVMKTTSRAGTRLRSVVTMTA
jgi:hypothetical protein